MKKTDISAAIRELKKARAKERSEHLEMRMQLIYLRKELDSLSKYVRRKLQNTRTATR